jgi:hypothetical protein
LERERGGDGNHHAKLALRFLLFPRQRERETGEVGRLETRGREKKNKKKKKKKKRDNYLLPHKLQCLNTFPP